MEIILQWRNSWKLSGKAHNINCCGTGFPSVQVLVNVLYIVILCPRKVPTAQLMVLIVVMVSSTYYILVSHLKKEDWLYVLVLSFRY